MPTVVSILLSGLLFGCCLQVDADCNDSIDLGELRDLFELLGFPDEAERFAESYMVRNFLLDCASKQIPN